MTRWLRSGAVALATWFLSQARRRRAVRRRPQARTLFSNLTLGVFEVPRSIVDENRANGALSASTVGLAQGLAKAPTRLVLGVYEILSAPFGLPAEYVPMLEPEYVWEFANAAGEARVVAETDAYLSAEAERIGRIPGAIVARRDGALIVLVPAELLFSAGSSRVAESARSRIADLAVILEESPEARVQVVGHADASGDEVLNGALSAARAESLRGRRRRERLASARSIEAAPHAPHVRLCSAAPAAAVAGRRRV